MSLKEKIKIVEGVKIYNYEQVFGLTPNDYAIYMKLDKIDITGQNKKQKQIQDYDDSASSQNSSRFNLKNSQNCIDNSVYKVHDFISTNFYIKRTSKLF